LARSNAQQSEAENRKKRGTMETKGTAEKSKRKSPGLLIIFELWFVSFGLLLFGATFARSDGESKNLSILQAWSGDYPVSQLNRLPEGQRSTPVGYLETSAIFADVWQAFKPGERVPEVDFKEYLVVFSRNVNFYNRTSIAKVVLRDDIAEILAIETLSAMPIEDKVAMAMAVIPREAVKFIQAGSQRIPVASPPLSGDPLNTTYTIEGKEVHLMDGYHEKPAAPGSATKIKTSAFGKPVYGDLDGDGDEDAALFILQDSGGSGTFFYVAAVLKRNGTYRGTNAVFLGDRISPQTLKIRNSVIHANYADRRPDGSMAARPSIGKTKYLAIKNSQLEEIKPLRKGREG
jgi:hypothetical protein